MEFNVLSAFKGIEKEAINPFNPNEVGTSLFLNGGMGQKIKENMEKHAKKAGMDRRNFFRSSIGLSAQSTPRPFSPPRDRNRGNRGPHRRYHRRPPSRRVHRKRPARASM